MLLGTPFPACGIAEDDKAAGDVDAGSGQNAKEKAQPSANTGASSA